MSTDDLESQFHGAMLSVYEGAKIECKYSAVRFLQMVNEQGGLQAAKSLLRSGVLSDGLVKLWQSGRLDLSMEALILRPEWRSLFSDDEIAIARQRLADLGYRLP